MLTIRLTPAEKKRIAEAGRLKFNIEVGLATVARRILLDAVEVILESPKRRPRRA
jgi:hypothetical protein